MSMIQFSCPECNTQYKVPAKAAGKQATCKSCNKSMTVPAASQGSGGGASQYEDDVVAPPVEAGSVFAPTSSRRSGPSPVLLMGIGGGVLVLILAVVLIVVLTSGGGKKSESNNTTTASNTTNTDNDSSSRGRGRNRNRGGDSSDETDEDADEDNTETEAGREIDSPGAALAGVQSWELNVPSKVASITQEIEFRGMVMRFPTDWDSETTAMSTIATMSSDLRDTLTEAFGDEVLETAFFGAAPRELSVDVEFGVLISRAITHSDWPELSEVERMSSATQMDKAKMQDLQEEAEDGDFSAAVLLAMLEGMTDSSSGMPFALNFLDPGTLFIKKNAYDRVDFGTLFGGYPFARVLLQNEEEDTQVLVYTGFVNDLRITFFAQAPARLPQLITDMDWIVRSTRLMSAREARAYAREDATYQMWMNDQFINVAYAGDNTPFADMDEAEWEGFESGTLFDPRAATRAVMTPLNQPYGIVPPEGMRVASTNRVGIRWFPNDNDLWLQLKVTKLEGRAQRTMSTPVMSPAEEGGPARIFVNSTAIPLPAGYEYSEIEAGDLMLHRILLPEHPSSNLRKVYYVLYDGASQVTIQAHYDKSRPQDLEALDAAAQSMSKL